ncbi:MAG TPA: DUF1585 domain-containing protein [Deltaproteobacteria bacterium]|nr:DUF1585 domain-containing protein [Deltaproteobacteria bacterium]
MPTPSTVLLSALLGACAPGIERDSIELLSPVEQGIRTSIALRGVRPTPGEIQRILDEPAALPVLIDAWLDEPVFGEIVRDMHDEILLLRGDIATPPPAMGPLEGLTLEDVHRATSEAPLRLVEDIVVHDRPYTEILTTDQVMTDAITSIAWGLAHDPEGPQWQRTTWTDGRPAAGLLSSTQLYYRWPSAGDNLHRGRAAMIRSTFLCDDLSARDVPPPTGGLDASAPMSEPACLACHYDLEPMAAALWGFKEYLPPRAMRLMMLAQCDPDAIDPDTFGSEPRGEYALEDLCYPLVAYVPANETLWAEVDQPPPALDGQPVEDLAALGQRIVDDPRFARCTARRFAGFLLQQPPEHLPDDLVEELAASFVETGASAKELVRRIVLSDAFLARSGGRWPELAGPRILRPEAVARQLEALTGFRWLARTDPPRCGLECWGEIDLLRSDASGFHTLLGGFDGVQLPHPARTPLPSQQLALARLAAEAAAHGVEADLAEADRGARRLLTELPDPLDADPEAVRAQLTALYLRILALPPSTQEIDALHTLYDDALTRHPDRAGAWRVVIAALLMDPSWMVF